MKLRVARPTDQLDAVSAFYRDGVGMTELYRFENHLGFDGVMLGQPGAPYHLELTHAHGHVAGRATSPDHLLVFYLPDPDDWAGAIERMKRFGYQPVKSFNPYWDVRGVTFEDPDGYRVVFQNAPWDG